MENLSLTTFDLVVCGVVLLSGLVALSSGLVRALLFVATWIGAIFIARALFPEARPYAQELISVPLIADIAAAAVPFLVSLIVLSIVADAIGRSVGGSSLRFLDRSLGLAFGLLFGGFLVSSAWLAWQYLMPDQPNPRWTQNSRTLPMISQGAQFLDGFMPPDFRRRPAPPPAEGSPPAGAPAAPAAPRPPSQTRAAPASPAAATASVAAETHAIPAALAPAAGTGSSSR